MYEVSVLLLDLYPEFPHQDPHVCVTLETRFRHDNVQNTVYRRLIEDEHTQPHTYTCTSFTGKPKACMHVCMYVCRLFLFRKQLRDVKAHEVVPSFCTSSLLCLSHTLLPESLHAF